MDGLVAILGISCDAKSAQPSDTSKSYMQEPNQKQAPRIVYVYNKDVKDDGKGIPLDESLKSLCDKHGYSVSMVASNWDNLKTKLKLSDKSEILILQNGTET